MLFDGIRDIQFPERYFLYKYTVVTLSTIIVTCVYLAQAGKTVVTVPAFLRFLVYFAAINCWLYVLRTGDELYFVSMPRGFYFEFYRVVLLLLTNAAFAYGLYGDLLCRDRILWAFRCLQFAGAVFQCIWLDISLPVPIAVTRPAIGYANIVMACGVLLLLHVLLGITGKKLLKEYRDQTTLP